MGYRLQATGYRLQATRYGLQVAGYRLQYGLQVAGYRLQAMGHGQGYQKLCEEYLRDATLPVPSSLRLSSVPIAMCAQASVRACKQACGAGQRARERACWQAGENLSIHVVPWFGSYPIAS